MRIIEAETGVEYLCKGKAVPVGTPSKDGRKRKVQMKPAKWEWIKKPREKKEPKTVKGKIFAQVAEKTDISEKEVKAAFRSIFSSVSASLAIGEKVSIQGFGTFDTKLRAATRVEHPKTGERHYIPARKVVVFKASSLLKKAVASKSKVTPRHTPMSHNLVAHVAEKTGLSKKDARAAFGAIFESINAALVQGDKLSIRGFGKLCTKKRRATIVEHPKTGERHTIPARRVPAFKASPLLKDSIQVRSRR